MFRLPQLGLLVSLSGKLGARTLASVARTQLPVIAPTSNIMARIGLRNTETVYLPHGQAHTVPVNTISMRLELPKDAWEQDAEKETSIVDNTVYADSVKRKRKLAMKKHKLRKRRRAARSLLKRLGKVKD